MLKNNIALSVGVNQTRSDDSLFIYLIEDDHFRELLNCGLNCETDIERNPWEFSIRLQNSGYILVQGGPVNMYLDTLAESNILEFPDFFPKRYAGRCPGERRPD